MRTSSLHAILLVLLIQPSLHAQLFGISAGAGFSSPIQEFSDQYGTGFSGNVTGEYQLLGSIALTVSGGYTAWQIRDGLGDKLLHDASLPGTMAVTGQVRNIPLSIGLRYYAVGSFGHSFLGLSTSTNIMKGSADARYDPQNGTPPVSASTQESWSATGFTIEAGTSFSLSDDWHVLAILSYNTILDLNREIIPKGTSLPANAPPPQARTIGATIGIQYR